MYLRIDSECFKGDGNNPVIVEVVFVQTQSNLNRKGIFNRNEVIYHNGQDDKSEVWGWKTKQNTFLLHLIWNRVRRYEKALTDWAESDWDRRHWTKWSQMTTFSFWVGSIYEITYSWNATKFWTCFLPLQSWMYFTHKFDKCNFHSSHINIKKYIYWIKDDLTLSSCLISTICNSIKNLLPNPHTFWICTLLLVMP